MPVISRIKWWTFKRFSGWMIDLLSQTMVSTRQLFNRKTSKSTQTSNKLTIHSQQSNDSNNSHEMNKKTQWSWWKVLTSKENTETNISEWEVRWFLLFFFYALQMVKVNFFRLLHSIWCCCRIKSISFANCSKSAEERFVSMNFDFRVDCHRCCGLLTMKFYITLRHEWWSGNVMMQTIN